MTTYVVHDRVADRRRLLSDHVNAAFLSRLRDRATVAEGGHDKLAVVAPTTGETLGELPRGSAEDVAQAARRGRAAQQAWAARSLQERTEVFLRFHDLVLKRREEVLDLLQLEAGKARKHALEEVIDTANVARYYARTAVEHLRPRRRSAAIPGATRVWEHHHPLGVVGFIVPWNYPLTLGISDAIPALIAGNAAVIKADQQTPYSALWAATLLDAAGLPDDLLHVVTGDGAVLGAPLIERVDYIMFTGSTRVGRIVARQCGERLIGCSMELGGKNAMIVLDDANLDGTVAGAPRAAFSNAGQLCISMERIYVHGSLYDEFARRFVERTRAMRLGAGSDSDMGSLISAKQLDAVSGHVEDAVAKGATVLTGGRPRPDVGPLFYEPTILADVTPEMTLYAEETFGPVVSLYRVASEEEAVERANDSAYGLNFSAWTSNEERGRHLATRLEAGTVNVNEGYAAAWGSTDAPMGGMRDSGVGSRHGAHGIQKYTQSQTVAVQRLPLDKPAHVSPALWERFMIGAVRLVRKAPGKR